MTTRVLTSCLLAVFLTSIAAAQNSLRPNTLPSTEAKPIQQASASRPAGPLKSAKEAQLLLHEALQISQSAKSLDQFNDIIDRCEQASSQPLTAEEMKYAKDLRAWAFNKRGEAHAASAAEFMSQGDDKEAARLDRMALEDFQQAVKLDPTRWKAIHNRGVSYGVLGLHDDAVADFTRVVELKPSYVNAWFNRAELHLENGRLVGAIRDYTEAIKLRPEDGSIYRQRGRSYSRAGRYQEALTDFDRAVQMDREDVISVVERGEANLRLHHWELAAADFRTAIDLDPNSAEGYRGAAWLMATCPQVKYRNTKVAVEAAQTAVELAEAQSKLDFTYLDTMAAAYANASRFAEAERTIRRAIPGAPLADAAAMKKRLALYASQRPFRDGPAATIQPASTRVNRR
jgi:tetratricopeptide (TPR) repeat protein